MWALPGALDCCVKPLSGSCCVQIFFINSVPAASTSLLFHAINNQMRYHLAAMCVVVQVRSVRRRGAALQAFSCCAAIRCSPQAKTESSDTCTHSGSGQQPTTPTVKPALAAAPAVSSCRGCRWQLAIA
jgi:hypothetical protein